ncbi:MAG: tetratricopeptide repeat protein [Bacteroidetes bacterium]|nr:tetratricopeptide repeat protein [Bacteroidota bacterium]
MKSNSLRTKINKKQCLIASNWLILLSIIVSFCIIGCVPTGQINNKKQAQNTNWAKSKKQKEKQVQNIASENVYEDNTLNDILEFEKRINSSSNNNNNTKQKKNITTSEDKYESLKQKQELMEEELNESIYNLKEELLEIKKMLGDVIGDKITPTAERKSYISPNESNIPSSVIRSEESINSDEDDIIDKTFIIKSEETKQMFQNSETKKVIKPEKTNNNAPNKNFKIIKDSDKQTPNNTTNIAPKSNVNNNSDANNSADNNFSEVISKIAKADYNTASKIVNDKLKQTKDPAIISNCNYWLGEITFNQRDYAKSIAYFKTALENNCDKKDIAQARIAEAYMRVGKNEEAKTTYKNLLKEHPQSIHSARAKKMLQQL